MSTNAIPSTSPAGGLHPCQVQGCTCTDYVFSGLADGLCAREGCGHHDYDHNYGAPNLLSTMEEA